jgi:energy-coupling factor transporter ATP-binding protein EcfA2
MDYTFKTLPGLSPSYTMLSQGQKRKLGFAISMAFRDFVSLVGNFNVNFLSLDEVLDISTDDNSMRDMLDLAKLMLADIGCAVIITHRGKVVSDKFDFHQAVTNNGLYSMLGPIKPMWEKEKETA